MTALQKLLRQLLYLLGVWGVIGVGVLAACVAFYTDAFKPAEQALNTKRASAKSTAMLTQQQRPVMDGRIDNLQQFHAQFPPLNRLDKEVEKLWVLANEYKIDLQSGEYRLESGGPGLIRYRVTLPMRASYVQLRLFLDTVLKTLPTVSVDTLRFERKTITDVQLEAQIRLTLHFRPEYSVTPPGQAQ